MGRTRIKTSKKGGILVAVLPVATSDKNKTGRCFNDTICLKKGHSGKIMSVVTTEQQAKYLMDNLR